jgi:hypothetical protein
MDDPDIVTLTLISCLVVMTCVIMVVSILSYIDARKANAIRPVRPVSCRSTRAFLRDAGVDREMVCRQ